MEDIIKVQRRTVNEHIEQENAHNWPAVHDTFVQSEKAFYDVVPLHTHFGGLSGVKDFYAAADVAFPDFRIDVWAEYDVPGCSIREVTISGTHRGNWCGLDGTGRKVKFHLLAVFLFGSGTESGKILAERVYFDNDTVLQQIRGTQDPSAVPNFVGEVSSGRARTIGSSA